MPRHTKVPAGQPYQGTACELKSSQMGLTHDLVVKGDGAHVTDHSSNLGPKSLKNIMSMCTHVPKNLKKMENWNRRDSSITMPHWKVLSFALSLLSLWKVHVPSSDD